MWGMGLLNGLRISMRNMRRGPITVKYPYERLELPERARWAVRPKYDESGVPACTACLTCVRTCPNAILDLEVTQREDRSKHIEHFRYELGSCMMCGLCVEACPFDAIEMGQDYELARLERDELTYDLLADVDAAGPRRAPVRDVAPASTPEAAAAQRGEPSGD
jgi:NADH-quinone oxidoreductase subunit I